MLPSPAARRFRHALIRAGIGPQKKAVMDALKDWFGKNWRYVPSFLSGSRRDFPDPSQLAEFLRERYGVEYEPKTFTNPRGVPDYLAQFCKDSPSSPLLHAIEGNYVCMRPGTEDLANPRNDLDFGPDIHELEITSQGDHQPGIFRFWTSKSTAAQVDVKVTGQKMARPASGGEWNGYVVSNAPFAFLFGLCVDAEDASFFILRQIQDDIYSDNILIGVQTLLLPHPHPHNAKHAVSRPIVALRSEFSTNKEMIAAALNWVRASRASFPLAGGLLFKIDNDRSAKT
jgi:hypothetical protein